MANIIQKDDLKKFSIAQRIAAAREILIEQYLELETRLDLEDESEKLDDTIMNLFDIIQSIQDKANIEVIDTISAGVSLLDKE